MSGNVFGPTASGSAGSVQAVTTVSSADYTALSSDEYIEVTTGASTRTITLPVATGNNTKLYRIKKIDSGAGFVKLSANNIEVSGNQSLFLIYQYDEITLVSNGTFYRILSWLRPQNPPNPSIINLLDSFTANTVYGGGVWTGYADAAGTSPVDGTGGSPTSSSSISTTTPLRPPSSLIFSKDAANRQGEGISAAFVVNPEYYASVLTIEFDHIVSSGTFVAGAGTTASDMTVWIYDVTNSAIIPVTPASLMSSSTTLPGHFKGTFQTSATGASYRLILHVGSTSASAYDVKFGNFRVGPTPAVYGAPVTDWTAWTPTGSWSTNTTYTGYWRRDGDSMEIDVKVSVSGAPTSASLTVNLPSGYTIDTTKLVYDDASTTVIGSGGIRDSGTETYSASIRSVSSTATKVNVMYMVNTATGVTVTTAVAQNAPQTWASGDAVTFTARFPIVGWSSSVQMSNDTDTRVVAAKYTTSATTSFGNGTYSSAFPYATLVFDTHGAMNASTGVYTVPVPGIYRVSAGFVTAAYGSGAVGRLVQIGLFKNGSVVSVVAPNSSQTTSSTPKNACGSTTVSCNAGDTLDIRGYSDDSPVTLAASPNNNFVSIERLSGPATIAPSEKIYLLATGDPASATSGNPIIVPTVAAGNDSHGGYNASTGRYTCPTAGVYEVYGALQSASSATTLTIYKNAVSTSLAGNLDSNGEATYGSAVNCLAGDIIDIRPGGTVDATNMTLNIVRL